MSAQHLGETVVSCAAITTNVPAPECRLFINEIVSGVVRETEKIHGERMARMEENVSQIRQLVERFSSEHVALLARADKNSNAIFGDDALRDTVRDHAKLLRAGVALLGAAWAAILVAAGAWLSSKWGSK